MKRSDVVDGSGSLDVFDSDGRFLGVLRCDVEFTMFPALPRLAGGYVYGITTDSLGAQYVVRARIERPDSDP